MHFKGDSFILLIICFRDNKSVGDQANQVKAKSQLLNDTRSTNVGEGPINLDLCEILH